MNKKKNYLLAALLLLSWMAISARLRSRAEERERVKSALAREVLPTQRANKPEIEDRLSQAAAAPEIQSTLDSQEVERIRSEMKMSLMAIYGAEKSFYSEYRRYSTDFRALGYMPEGELSSKAGFVSGYNPEKLVGVEDSRFLTTDDIMEIEKQNDAAAGFRYGSTAMDVNIKDSGQYCQRGCTADGEHFEVMSIAQLKEGQSPEAWVIDETKGLRQVSNGFGDQE